MQHGVCEKKCEKLCSMEFVPLTITTVCPTSTYHALAHVGDELDLY